MGICISKIYYDMSQYTAYLHLTALQGDFGSNCRGECKYTYDNHISSSSIHPIRFMCFLSNEASFFMLFPFM